ncbi:hypothetical protein [Roseimaritima ulvae]|uniref:hypothetical protein n=1 Tax=Roseimaritima ulvae TaxID=980254 RepID=UPI001AEFD3B4|nr:hypothetical protein [Roseimaritima ulvae]
MENVMVDWDPSGGFTYDFSAGIESIDEVSPATGDPSQHRPHGPARGAHERVLRSLFAPRTQR